jgi:hypothetical protein
VFGDVLEADRLRFAVPFRHKAGIGRLGARGALRPGRGMKEAAAGAGPAAQYLVIGLNLVTEAERAPGSPANGTFKHRPFLLSPVKSIRLIPEKSCSFKRTGGLLIYV